MGSEALPATSDKTSKRRWAGWVLRCLAVLGIWAEAAPAGAQSPAPPTGPLTLEQCLYVALQQQPAVRQARLDEETAEANIRIGLAGWLPQVALNNTSQHFFELPFVVFPNADGQNVPRQVGLRNTSSFALQGTQVLYNNDVWLARRLVRPLRVQARQNTETVRIAVVSDVSKAFFDVLLAQRQLGVFEADMVRLERSLRDARARYEAGISDKIDFKQAEIALNTSRAARKQAQEAVNARSAVLKERMGLAAEQPLQLTYDTLRLEQAAAADTAAGLDVAARVELQQLQTAKQLQAAEIQYYRWGFLPSLAAFGTYNRVYQNNNLRDLYSQAFPSYLAGVQFSLPIFQGTRRLQNLRRARLLDQRLDQDLVATRNLIGSEFQQALAAYKGNFADYQIGKRNLALAQEVFQVVELQYREGIKPYLDVIVAQTTLRTAALNYYVALFQVLNSKVDLQRAQGALNTNY